MPWAGKEATGDEFPTLGHLAAEWIESTLPITDGPKAGQPFRLYDEQYLHLLHRYRLDPEATEADENDAFIRNGSMLVRGQKWGKDPLMAAILLFHAFGPCDFAGWNADGQPVGRERPSPWVFIAALNDRQTDNTWLPLKAMVEESELGTYSGVDVTLEQIRLPCGNPIEPLTTTAFGRLGGRFTAGSLTENGLMTDTLTTPSGGGGQRSPLEFARTLIRSVNALSGMWIAATNTWDPTQRSHAQLIYESFKRTGSRRIYVDARVSRQKVDLDDDDQLRDELLYLYGDSARENGGHVSVRSLMQDCRDVEVHGETQIRRFFLSEILAGERVLAEPELWDSLARPKGHADHDPLRPGEAISLGFDGSRSRDATVLTACRIRDGRLFHLRTWLPTYDSDSGTWKVDRRAIDRAVRDTFTAYSVAYLFADPYKWQDYLDVWAGAYPKRVIEYPTNEERRMDKAIVRFLSALRERELTHDGDETALAAGVGEQTLSQHIRDTVLKNGKVKPAERQDDDGRVLQHYQTLAKRAEGVLIDAAVSAVLAYAARGQAIEDGALVTKTRTPFVIFGDD